MENFVDEYLYKLYYKIKENKFSSWMFDPYYTDPEELVDMKLEKMAMFENTDFLEIRKSYLHYEDVFETIEDEIEEFAGTTSKYIKTKRQSNQKTKIDYDVAHRNQKEVGDTGEEEVLKRLRKRFKNNEELLKKIEHVSIDDDSKGYDICYVDEKGFKNYIEVKTNSNASDNKFTFFISKNEDEFLRNNERASIYYVKLHPKVKITKIPREKYLEMEKEAVNYLVDVECL